MNINKGESVPLYSKISLINVNDMMEIEKSPFDKRHHINCCRQE